MDENYMCPDGICFMNVTTRNYMWLIMRGLDIHTYIKRIGLREDAEIF